MSDQISWAEYRESHWITDAEEPAAFASYLNYLSGRLKGGAALPRVGGAEFPADDAGNGPMRDADHE